MHRLAFHHEILKNSNPRDCGLYWNFSSVVNLRPWCFHIEPPSLQVNGRSFGHSMRGARSGALKDSETRNAGIMIGLSLGAGRESRDSMDEPSETRSLISSVSRGLGAGEFEMSVAATALVTAIRRRNGFIAWFCVGRGLAGFVLATKASRLPLPGFHGSSRFTPRLRH